jgi:dTDP-glucose 4,6-dehydratase
VKDTVRAYTAVLGSQKTIGETINFGSNFEISIGDTVKLIAELMETDIKVETENVRRRPEKSEVERLWADIAKAKMLTGWTPSYGGLNGFKKGLGETIRWFRNAGHLAQYKSHLCNI